MSSRGISSDQPAAEDHDTTTGSLERQPTADGPPVLYLCYPSGVQACTLPLPGSVIVGRSREANVAVEHPSVSRLHVRIDIRARPRGGFALYFEDLSSANGTRVHGDLIPPGVPTRVDIGAPVQLGSDCLLTVHGSFRGAPQRAEHGVEETMDLVEPRNETEGDASGGDSPRRPAKGPPRISSLLRSSYPVEGGGRMVAVDPRMQELYLLAERVAMSDISVMILGETGSGKEVLARFLHQHSARAEHPFVALNCGSVAPTLIESELFGHAKGAFTGAVKETVGLIESAGEGSLFLDEVGEMPLEMQVKLLRVIEERQIRRVGSLESTAIRARFICATNQTLEAQVDQGTFRSDLYYRLKGLTLTLPPLRERTIEIPAMAHTFLAAAAASAGRAEVPTISDAAMSELMGHPWPGNIRQLKSAVECAFVLAGGGEINPEHLPRSVTQRLEAPSIPSPGPEAPRPVPRRSVSMSDTLIIEASRELLPRSSSASGEKRALSVEIDALERTRIVEALDACGGNQTQAASMLGISRNTLIARLKTYNIPRPRKSRSRGDSASGE